MSPHLLAPGVEIPSAKTIVIIECGVDLSTTIFTNEFSFRFCLLVQSILEHESNKQSSKSILPSSSPGITVSFPVELIGRDHSSSKIHRLMASRDPLDLHVSVYSVLLKSPGRGGSVRELNQLL
ncbi:hypothetical protein FNV43_RR17256 [Rhamnella rubrinervis]|uniref:Uncharacterized protein n=1 Tax=Rhamnella rubrinervis TaxID=2594499 RepID=A0A8K0DYG5_9ROSA|nr:hypothetical protein FNV43_RR17256 [Rhamnella rubrinervis]